MFNNGWGKSPFILNQNVTSHNQTGGITAHTVHLGPQQRSLAAMPDLQAQILKDLPRDKPVKVMAVLGDAETSQFGLEIHAFLKANKFALSEPDGISHGMFTVPQKGLTLETGHKDEYLFVVGANLA